MAVGIAVAGSPVAKERALFEACVALAEKIGLGQSDALQGGSHGRPGAFTYADSGHIRGFDQKQFERLLRIRVDPMFGRNDSG